ncbi:MAG TPA: TonB family protein [Thermodesulfobacteriota bacterium]|nr:TonB family protein [Thermodesulfobacteriota bacterium]
MSNLKIPFIVSVLFHGITLFSVAVFYQPAREALMNVTPVEFIHLSQEESAQPIKLKQRAEQANLPKKIKTSLPQNKEESKEEPKEIIAPSITKQAVETETPHVHHSSTITQQEASIQAQADNDRKEGDSKQSLPDDKETGSSSEVNLFTAMVRNKIENVKFYPRWARERGYEGIVGVQFLILPDGNITNVKIVRPCHCEVLNSAAREAIMKAAPFSPRPNDIEDKEIAMEIDIGFRLE